MYSRNITDKQTIHQDDAGEEVEQESIQHRNSTSNNTQTEGSEKTVKDSSVGNMEQEEMKFEDDNDSVTEHIVTSSTTINVHQINALKPSEFGVDSPPENYDSDDSEETHSDGVIHPVGMQPTQIGIDSTPENYGNQSSSEKQNIASVNLSVVPQKYHLNPSHVEPRNNNSGAVIDPSTGNLQPASVTSDQGNLAYYHNSLILIERFSQEQLAVVVSQIIRNPNDSLESNVTESLCAEINTFVKEYITEDELEEQPNVTTNSDVVVPYPTNDTIEIPEEENNNDTVAYQVKTGNVNDSEYAIADSIEKVPFIFFGKHIGRKKAFIAMVIVFALISAS